MIPLWNSWYFFQLYANAAGPRGRRASTDVDRPARPLPAGQVPAVRRADDHRRWTSTPIADACDSTRVFIDVLTNWYIRRSRDRFWEGDHAGLRHALHGARDGLPGHRAAAAADDRGGLARPDRRALGAPRPTGRWPTTCPPTTPWSRRWTRSARSARRPRRCARPAACATGCRWPRSPSSSTTPTRSRLRRDRRRRGQRQGGAAARRRLARGGGVRRLAAAHRQRPRRRPAARQGRPARDQGLEVRRLVGGRGRHRHRGRARAGRGRVHPRDRGRLRRRVGTAIGVLPGGGFVVLDTAVTPELARRAWPATWSAPVQQARRDAGLDVSDRIALTIAGSDGGAGGRPHPRAADHRRDPGDVVRRGRRAPTASRR